MSTIDATNRSQVFDWKTGRKSWRGLVARYAQGEQPSELAERYGITQAEVMRLVKYRPPVTRLTKRGLRYTVRRNWGWSPKWTRTFENGWEMEQDGDRFYAVTKENGDDVCHTWAGARVAQWEATIKFLEEQFPDAPDRDTYLAAAKPAGEWTPLRVWADRLDELDCPDGQRLRQLLPLLPGERRTTKGRTP